MTEERVTIVGAGLAGLGCAYYLEKLGYAPLILEREGEPGGRVATESYEGYLLDKGFQVLLTSYSEIKKIVRLYELELGRFPPGVNIYYEGSWYPFYNPLQKPLSVLQSRNLPFVTFADKVKLSKLYFKMAWKLQSPYFRDEAPTALEFLKKEGLSPTFIETVIRPFFGGVLLDRSLHVNEDIFLWLLHFFIEGVAALPRQGMQQLARAIASKLVKTTFRYNTVVRAVHGQTLYLEGGEEVVSDKIALALGAEEAKQLISSLPELPTRGVTTLYFTGEMAEFQETASPLLHLNGEARGPINHLAFPSVVQPSYAPAGKLLVAATVLDDPAWTGAPNLIEEVQEQLVRWFGEAARRWRHLKSYYIERALPDQRMPPPLQGLYQIDRYPDIYLCGEYVDDASLNGALTSGRRAADAIDAGIKRLKTL